MEHRVEYRLTGLGQLPHADYVEALPNIRDTLRAWGTIVDETEGEPFVFLVHYDDVDLWDLREAAEEVATNLSSYADVEFSRPVLMPAMGGTAE